MGKTTVMATSVLLAVGYAGSVGGLPLGTANVPTNPLVQTISDSSECAGIKASRAEVQDSRDAYNGNESNWALKDEIRDLDNQLNTLDDELVAANCS